jgi:hypothetical protein
LATARWAKQPIAIGHRDWDLRPLVVGPDNIPVITDPDEVAERPWLAVLSALTHHDHEQRDLLFRALLDGVINLEGREAVLYT